MEQKKMERMCWPNEVRQDSTSNANMAAMRIFQFRSTFAQHTRIWGSETLYDIRFFKNMNFLFV
jgi:hypothetical protein